MKKYNIGDGIFNGILYIIMIAVGLMTVFPFINVLALSFNDGSDAVAGGIYFWPRVFTFKNYQEVIAYPSLVRGFYNSVLRTAIGSIIGTFLTAMMAYTLSRRDFIARKLFTKLFTITMFVSGGLIPSYLLMKELHLNENFLVYIIPGVVWAFCIFVVRSYMDGLPISLQESAMLDGANDFTIFIKIIFPLCMPCIATIILFYAVGHWNSWFDTFLYCSRNEKLTTLQFELQKILKSAEAAAQIDPSLSYSSEQLKLRSKSTPQSIQMAITMVATAPIIVVYPFLQKYFVKGMTLGAIKA